MHVQKNKCLDKHSGGQGNIVIPIKNKPVVLQLNVHTDKCKKCNTCGKSIRNNPEANSDDNKKKKKSQKNSDNKTIQENEGKSTESFLKSKEPDIESKDIYEAILQIKAALLEIKDELKNRPYHLDDLKSEESYYSAYDNTLDLFKENRKNKQVHKPKTNKNNSKNSNIQEKIVERQNNTTVETKPKINNNTSKNSNIQEKIVEKQNNTTVETKPKINNNTTKNSNIQEKIVEKLNNTTVETKPKINNNTTKNSNIQEKIVGRQNATTVETKPYQFLDFDPNICNMEEIFKSDQISYWSRKDPNFDNITLDTSKLTNATLSKTSKVITEGSVSLKEQPFRYHFNSSSLPNQSVTKSKPNCYCSEYLRKYPQNLNMSYLCKK